MINAVFAQLDRITLPEKISRYDNAARGSDGWHTEVTPQQMLVEMLYALANGGPAHTDTVSVTVCYAPGDSDEEWERRNQYYAERGMVNLFPRTPGRHHVTLWQSRFDEDDDEWRSDEYLSFLFTTDPDIDFWEGI